MKNLFVFLPFLIILFSCNTSKKVVEQKRASSLSQMEILKTCMTGSFNSSAQAAADSTYYDISLHMYPIWRSKKGNWLYVEQAVTSNPTKPYRQRVYQLEQVNSTEFISRVYLLDAPEKYVGKWRRPSYFNSLDESILTEKIGCEVYLKKQKNGTFKGSTDGKNCSSTMRGANYASSIVEIGISVIESWDQGFDSEDKQVWGAEKGGYIFKKQ